MQTENRAVSKRCPRCKQSDFTDFSTCRYCSAPYDAQTYQANRRASSDVPTISPFRAFMGLFSIGMLFAVPYLCSQGLGGFATTGRHYGLYRGVGRPSMISVPIALTVFGAKKMINDAQSTIEKENAVLAQNRNNYDAYLQRGDAYWTQFKADQALQDYGAAIALRPRSREAYEKRAMVYDAMANPDLAKKDRDSAQALQ